MAVLIRRVAPALVLLCLLCVPPAVAGSLIEEPAAPPVLPSTIQVDPMLQSVIATMLDKSPTFRRQCREIAAARIVVAVHLVPSLKNSGTQATTTLRRYTSGLMIAHVELPAATPLSQSIGHEFEHIAEFIEGVDLDLLIVERPNEAVRRLDGAYETWRAVHAGRAIHAEVSGR